MTYFNTTNLAGTQLEIKEQIKGLDKGLYTNNSPNRSKRRASPGKEHNNRKGDKRTYAIGRNKFYKVRQRIGKKLIIHYIDPNERISKKTL